MPQSSHSFNETDRQWTWVTPQVDGCLAPAPAAAAAAAGVRRDGGAPPAPEFLCEYSRVVLLALELLPCPRLLSNPVIINVFAFAISSVVNRTWLGSAAKFRMNVQRWY